MEMLALVLILTLGFAARCWMRMRRAERSEHHLSAANDVQARLIESQRVTIADLLERHAEKDRLWKDMKSRYLDALDEIAALREGAAE